MVKKTKKKKQKKKMKSGVNPQKSNKTVEQKPEQTLRKLRFFGKTSVIRPTVAALLRLGVWEGQKNRERILSF